jgi:hypothetical protein
VGLQYALKRLSQALNTDGYAWQDYVIAKLRGVDEALYEHALTELNRLATPEFMAKVFARASRTRDEAKSEAEVRVLVNRLVGWGLTVASNEQNMVPKQ